MTRLQGDSPLRLCYRDTPSSLVFFMLSCFFVFFSPSFCFGWRSLCRESASTNLLLLCLGHRNFFCSLQRPTRQDVPGLDSEGSNAPLRGWPYTALVHDPPLLNISDFSYLSQPLYFISPCERLSIFFPPSPLCFFTYLPQVFLIYWTEGLDAFPCFLQIPIDLLC